MTGSTPLIATAGPEGSLDRSLDRPIAWRKGRPVSRATFLGDVQRIAAQLPAAGHLINLCADRYRFAVTFCAAVSAGRISLLPPNHSPEFLARLREQYADLQAIHDGDSNAYGTLPVWRYPRESEAGSTALDNPSIDDDAIVAHVFTSGSTGAPTIHHKRWGALAFNVRSEALRLGITADIATTMIGTVPAQHMYGFESTVLLALQNGLAFNGGSPFYPADIVAAVESIAGARILVTTPFHLRTLLSVPGTMPALKMIVCATAPLSRDLAFEAERRFGAPLLEIYGCTEAGQLATRRPVDGEIWETFRGVTIEQRIGPGGADQWLASGGHIDTPTPLSDRLALRSAQHFELLGRGADLVNVAGKRSSLAYLDHLLCAVAGVSDGAFFDLGDTLESLPEAGPLGVTRLMAFYVSSHLTERDVLAALRGRTDSVFLPRPLIRVDRLPRAATGKLPREALAEFARQHLADRAGRQPLSDGARRS